jgi:hypothetical protein
MRFPAHGFLFMDFSFVFVGQAHRLPQIDLHGRRRACPTIS